MISARQSRLIWCVALAVLAAALVFFNRPGALPDPAADSAPEYASDAPRGYEPGEAPADFELIQMDGARFALSEHRGQVVVINLWATWCAPCVGELPSFDRLSRDYGEEVAVLAIHSDLITDDVEAFLSNYDYDIAFAIDEEGGAIASLGGTTMLPQTIILDADGIVTYNRVGSMTYETLEALVNAALNG